MMSPEQRKKIEERASEAALAPYPSPVRTEWSQLGPGDVLLLNDALDAAESRAKAAEERVEELEAALEFSYTLACRGVERIDEENKTCGPRLSLAHRRRLMIMCNQIKYHKDKWLRAEERDNAVEVGG